MTHTAFHIDGAADSSIDRRSSSDRNDDEDERSASRIAEEEEEDAFHTEEEENRLGKSASNTSAALYTTRCSNDTGEAVRDGVLGDREEGGGAFPMLRIPSVRSFLPFSWACGMRGRGGQQTEEAARKGGEEGDGRESRRSTAYCSPDAVRWRCTDGGGHVEVVVGLADDVVRTRQ